MRDLATVVVEVAHGRCLERGVADGGNVALDGLDGQAAELLEQALVVGEHVGRQRAALSTQRVPHGNLDDPVKDHLVIVCPVG